MSFSPSYCGFQVNKLSIYDQFRICQNKKTIHWEEQMGHFTPPFNLTTKWTCLQLLSFYSRSFHPLVSLRVWCFQTNIFRFTDTATQAAMTASVNLHLRTFEPHNQNKALLPATDGHLLCHWWGRVLTEVVTCDDCLVACGVVVVVVVLYVLLLDIGWATGMKVCPHTHIFFNQGMLPFTRIHTWKLLSTASGD